MNPDDKLFLPLKGQPLPEGSRMALDVLHKKMLDQGVWPPAQRVLAEHGGPCDLVLLAVPEGWGMAFAQYLADQVMLVQEPAA
jgi:hypothetical protein